MRETDSTTQQRLQARIDERTFDFSIKEENGAFRVQIGEESFTVHRRDLGPKGLMSLLIDGRPHEVDVEEGAECFSVNVGGVVRTVEIFDPLMVMAKKAARETSGPAIETIEAPMPGLVVSVEVGVGDRVEAGTPVVVVEAMKMQNELAAVHGGLVRQINVEAGQKVDTREALIVLELEQPGE